MDKYKEALKKAKAYNEALELMRDCVPDEDGLVHVRPSDIFSELAESGDERIRKEIISYFKQFDNEELRGVDISDWIAWLEKLKVFAEHGDGLYHFGNNSFTYVGNPTWDNVSWLEKQGEQKPAEKVEPKFKVGDWIVTDKNHIWLIDEDCSTNGYSYRLISQNGKVEVGDYNIVDEHAHLWAIQDAKSCDVLADEYGIYLFNSCDSLDDKLFICKCAYEYSKQLFEIGGMLCKKTDVYPATKEQRDLLFQKMHEAGYTFDFEKKEPKKLKFRVGDEVITENEESLTITRIDEEGYWSNDLFICDFDRECVWDLVEKKPPEWKQENREELTEFENAMMHIGGSFFGENAGLDPNDTDTIKEQAELLLELAPKTEWSEKDEKMYRGVMAVCDVWSTASSFYPKEIEYVERLKNWLKSLKTRITWKPSDEQMKALADALSLAKNCGEEMAFDLRTLYEQLKKLKGE